LSRRTAALGLLALMLARVALAVILYDPARVWLTQDDYCRALMAVAWGRDPYLYPGDLHWLSLPFYVYGLASHLVAHDWHPLFAGLSQTASILTLWVLYRLGRLFFARGAAIIACGFFTFAGWPIVLGYAALAEPLYYLLTLTGVYGFALWWTSSKRRRARRGLVLYALCLALAMLTRYEAWVLGALCVGLGIWHLRKRNPERRTAVVDLLLLAAPFVAPAWWITENLRVLGVPLAFYDANRSAFRDALYALGPLGRVLRYPVAFVLLCVPLAALLAAAPLLDRRRFVHRPALLWLIAGGHFTAITLLYISGSGPSFVDRIVLPHLLLLLPVCGAVIAAGLASPRRAAKAAAGIALLVAVISGPVQAKRIIDGKRWHGYRVQADEYLRLSRYLRDALVTEHGLAAVNAHDAGLFIRFMSGYPNRVVEVTGETAAEIFRERDIALLAVPAEPMDRWQPDERIETAFRAAAHPNRITESRLGNWRILRPARPDEWPPRAESLREQMRHVLSIPTARVALASTVHGGIDADAYTIQKVTYAAEPGSRVTANLYLPTHRVPPYPGVLVACGHGGSKSTPYAQYAGQLYASLGFACLVSDTIGEEERHHERTLGSRAHDMYPLKDDNPEFVRTKLKRLILGKIVLDLMRGLDYLESRPDVDAERLGCMGYSLGGASAGSLAILDKRVRAAVITGWAHRARYATLGKYCTRMPYAAFMSFMEPREMTALAAPHAAVLFINGDSDDIIDADAHGAALASDLQRNLERARPLLEQTGSVDRVQARFVPGGSHRPYFLTRAAAQWLVRHLGRPDEPHEIPPTDVRLGDWADAQGITFEPLYNTEARERGCAAVDCGAVYRSPDELACLPLDAPPPPEYTFAGWINDQLARNAAMPPEP
jgi:dienelactone hydrolase